VRVNGWNRIATGTASVGDPRARRASATAATFTGGRNPIHRAAATNPSLGVPAGEEVTFWLKIMPPGMVDACPNMDHHLIQSGWEIITIIIGE